MGLESLPHLALGNTTKGLTQVVVGSSAPQYSYSDWLQDQASSIKENAYQNSRYATARYVQKMNAICKKSSVFSPTIKSLAYFSEVDGLLSSHREEQKLIPVKNPVAFGAMVYKATQELASSLGADISYYAPSEFVGLEMAEKGLLVENSLNINFKSIACRQYADSYEAAFVELQKLIVQISRKLEVLTTELLLNGDSYVEGLVAEIIEAYNYSIQSSVEAGLSYTILEDVWLNKKMSVSKRLGRKMTELFSYAEDRKLEYKTAYPNYKESVAESCMKENITSMSVEHYALYSEVFGKLRTKEVTATSGKTYQIGYTIPHMVYMKTLVKDLGMFEKRLSVMESLEDLEYMV